MKQVVFIMLLSVSAYSMAGDVVLSDVDINRLYTQSHDGSTAHLVSIKGASLPEICHGNRLYIDFEDEELYSAVLANYMAGKTVHLVYNAESTIKIARRHASISCKLISIY